MNNEGYLMKSGEAAEYLCLSAQTVRLLEERGFLIPHQLYPSGHRKYSRRQIEDFLARIGDEGGIERTRDDYMSSKEVCKFCGFSLGLLNTLEKDGILKPRRVYPISHKRLYLKTDVEKFYDSMSKPRGAAHAVS